MVETTSDRGGKITWLFRNENWPCRRAVFGLKISLEPWQKVVVSGGSMPQQRQRGSSQQTSSSFRTTAYIPVHTPIPPLSTPLPFPFQRSPHLHRHLRSSPFYVPLLYLRALRASSSFYLSLSLSLPSLIFFPFLTPSNPQPSHRSPVGALIRLRSATTVLMRM